MSIRKAYTDWAATYDADRNLTRDLDQVVTGQMLAGRACGTVLELGCGTGKNTPLLAGIGRRVCALDFTEDMIRQAQAKVQRTDVRRGNVLFAVADLTQTWPCAAGSVDLAVCNLVLEHIADLGFIFAEAGRVLADRGTFFVSELHPFRQYLGKRAIYTGEQGPTEIAAFVHHISDFLAATEAAGLRR